MFGKNDLDSILELLMLMHGWHEVSVSILSGSWRAFFKFAIFTSNFFSQTVSFSEGKKVGTQMDLSTETCIYASMIWDSIQELSTFSLANLRTRKSVSDFLSLNVYFNQGKKVGKHIPRPMISVVFTGRRRYSSFVVSAYVFSFSSDGHVIVSM